MAYKILSQRINTRTVGSEFSGSENVVLTKFPEMLVCFSNFLLLDNAQVFL